MLLSSKIRMCEVQTMLKIGEFSKLSRISIRMLRHYDEIGLLRTAEGWESGETDAAVDEEHARGQRVFLPRRSGRFASRVRECNR